MAVRPIISLGVTMLLAWPHAASFGALPAQSTAVASRDLHNYAGALFEVLIIEHAYSQRASVESPGIRQQLRAMADSEIARVMARHDLDARRFNAISGTVEQDARLRRQVRQLVMEKKVGF